MNKGLKYNFYLMQAMAILLFLCSSFALFAFDLSRSVDRTTVTLGEPLLFKVTALRKPEEKLIFPGPDQGFGDFELRNSRSAEEPKGSLVQETHEYQLVLFKLGGAKIPEVRVINAKDTADHKQTEPVEIVVKAVSGADSGDILDIYGQERIGYGKVFWLTVLGVILLLGIGIYLLDRYVLKRQRPMEKPAEPPVPPEIQFEKDLAALLAARHLEKREHKEFHLKISEILRRYLGARMGFYALESTTTELLAMLKSKQADREVMHRIESFCEINDPVKFAKWTPSQDMSESLITLAREIKDKTTPKETPPAASDAPRAPTATAKAG
jgi:hypothetical protein